MSQAIAHALLWHILHEGVTLEPTKQVGVDKQRLVLLELAAHADAGGVSWPGRKYLAEKLQMPERTVSEALAVLEAQGLVSRTAPKKRGQLVRWRVLPGVLPTLLGLAEGGEVVGEVVREVVRQHVGLARHEEEVEVEVPPTDVSDESGSQRSSSPKGAGKKAAKGSDLVEDLTQYLVQRDLQERPPTTTAGIPLRRKKAAEARPHAERVAALPYAAHNPKAAERVAWEYYRGNTPAKHDLARLEGREDQLYRSAQQVAPVQTPTKEEAREIWRTEAGLAS